MAMALKDILVHLDITPRSATRLEIAAHLAKQHGAYLTGLHVIDIPSANYFYGAAMPFVPANPEEIVQRIRAEATEAAGPVEAAFRDALHRNGIEGEWQLLEGAPSATVALYARYADLTVVGQPNRDEPQDADAVTVTTVMTSGRPVLAIPFAGEFPTIGERVLIAWNASREAARAVNDAGIGQIPEHARDDRGIRRRVPQFHWKCARHQPFRVGHGHHQHTRRIRYNDSRFRNWQCDVGKCGDGNGHCELEFRRHGHISDDGRRQLQFAELAKRHDLYHRWNAGPDSADGGQSPCWSANGNCRRTDHWCDD
jgi:nucleotide-binding universal stress UspA family protein